MFRNEFFRFVAVLQAGSLTIALAASMAIGVATSQGRFRVDDSPVAGNATLFEGTLVETGGAPSTLVVDGGTRLQLGAGSKGRVYKGKLVLEQGVGQLENAAGYRLEAKNLQFTPAMSGTARIQHVGTGRVEVEAISAPISVTTTGGTLIANLSPGNALAFETQLSGAAGAAAPFHVTGCVQKSGSSFILKDDTASVSFDLHGMGLDEHVGHRVEITGTSLGKADAIQVAGVKAVSGSCPVRAPARKPAQKAAAAHMGPVAKSIIAGVVVASAGAGAAVALGDEPAKQAVSR